MANRRRIVDLLNRAVRRVGPQTGLMLAFGIGLVSVSAIVAIQSRQHAQITEHLAERSLVRTAMLRVTEGYLRLSLAGPAANAPLRQGGLSKLQDAEAVLRNALGSGHVEYLGTVVTVTGENSRNRLRAMADDIARFRQMLDARRTFEGHAATNDPDLQEAFSLVEEHAAAAERYLAAGASSMIERDDLLQTGIIHGSGLLVVLIGILVVVSQRAGRRARSALRESETLSRVFFDQSPIGATIVAPDGHLLRVNDAFCRFTGRSAEELTTLTVTDTSHPEDTGDMLRSADALLDGRNRAVSALKRYTRPDGSSAWGEVHSALVRDGRQQPQYFLCHVVDITARRLAEEEQRASHARFTRLLEMLPLPLIHVGRNGDVEFINDRFVEVYGYTREELPTVHDWFRLAYPDSDDRQRAYGRWTSTRAGGPDMHDHETNRVTTKSGEVREVQVSSIGLGEEVLAAFLDVTERERSRRKMAEMMAALTELNAKLEERVLERTAELSAANQELDSFAYAVSHDLRAPLRAMSGFSQAIVEDYGETLQPDARGYLEQIRKASHNMTQLVDGLLVLSRSTRGGVRWEHVDLSAMAERLTHELATGLPDRVPPCWDIQPGLAVNGDARMLESVVRNLLSNAWKYSSQVERPLVRFFREKRDGVPWFCVSDNGAGFDMRHASRLFKPFQRLHRQDEFPGIGIGLATVQRVINRHGGTIEAVAAVGQGATFRFHIPDHSASESEES